MIENNEQNINEEMCFKYKSAFPWVEFKSFKSENQIIQFVIELQTCLTKLKRVIEKYFFKNYFKYV